ncbi:MAG: nucleotidyltransferase family protein [Burkholderiaceae bacterium]
MNRETALHLLAKHKPKLQRQFGVRSLALFGSTARGTALEGSDVDVLVSFDSPTTSQQYFGAQFYLEDVFKCSVDLVTEKALRKELRPHIERDAVHV